MNNVIREAIKGAKAALVGDSNDAEHNALVSLVVALGENLAPECNCRRPNERHLPGCPCAAWEDKS